MTLVDTWFGKLVDTIDRLGLKESTLILFLSDHGTNFADNAERVTGKPAGYMYPGTMDIPLLVRHPSGVNAGTVCDELVYTLDVPATVIAASTGAAVRRDRGAEPAAPRGGRARISAPASTSPAATATSCGTRTRRAGTSPGVDFQQPRLFDLEADPECRDDIAARCPERTALARERILADAGGRLPRYEHRGTDALGRPTQQTGGTA